MSASSSARVQAALDTLCDVEQEELQSHWSKAVLAYQKLQIAVEGREPPRASGDLTPLPKGSGGQPLLQQSFHRPISSTISLGDRPVPPNNHDLSLAVPSARSHCSSLATSSADTSLSSADSVNHYPTSLGSHKYALSLIEVLKKKSTDIQTFLSRPEIQATGEAPEWMSEDPRVVDLKIGERGSARTQFRRCLSQRSLATEYSNWDVNQYGKSRVHDLIQDRSFFPSHRSSGHITAYLNHYGHRFKNTSVARKGIEHGIKLLVIESLFNARTSSAILSFSYHILRSVKFEEFDYLVIQLKSLEWVMVILEQKAEWFDNCQKNYNACFQEFQWGNTLNMSYPATKYNCKSNQCLLSNTTQAQTKDNNQGTEHRLPQLSRKRCRFITDASSNAIQSQTTLNGQASNGLHVQPQLPLPLPHVQPDSAGTECATVQYHDNSAEPIELLTKAAYILSTGTITQHTYQDRSQKYSIDYPAWDAVSRQTNDALGNIPNLNPHQKASASSLLAVQNKYPVQRGSREMNDHVKVNHDSMSLGEPVLDSLGAQWDPFHEINLGTQWDTFEISCEALHLETG